MQKALFILLISLCLTACTTVKPVEYQHGKSCFDTGNYKGAFRLLLPVAYAGDCRAQYAIGYIYFYGLAGPADPESGIFWIEKSARQRYIPAIRALEIIRKKKLYPEKDTRRNPRLVSSADEINQPVKENFEFAKPLAVVSTNHYSLQLKGDYDLETIKATAAKLNLDEKVFYGKTLHHNRDWYVLLYGDYRAPYLAKLAELDLPPFLRQYKPSIRKTDQIERIA